MSPPVPRAPHHVEYDKVRMAHLFENAGFRFKSAGEFAQLGIRSIILANGGALIAMLTFLGNASKIPPPDWPLWVAFFSFVLGLVMSLLGVLCAYVTQSEYARQDSSSADKIYFGLVDEPEPAVDLDKDEDKHMKQGSRWEWCAVGAFLVALVLFFAGCTFGMISLSSIPADAASVSAVEQTADPASLDANHIEREP